MGRTDMEAMQQMIFTDHTWAGDERDGRKVITWVNGQIMIGPVCIGELLIWRPDCTSLQKSATQFDKHKAFDTCS